MTRKDWFQCHLCKFPGIGDILKSVVRATGSCPMCSRQIDEFGIVEVTDPIGDSFKDGFIGQSKNNYDDKIGVGGLASA